MRVASVLESGALGGVADPDEAGAGSGAVGAGALEGLEGLGEEEGLGEVLAGELLELEPLCGFVCDSLPGEDGF